MDSKSMPALKQVGGTKVSRRTVTRGVAWSVPVAAVAYTAPAYASSQPPVLAGQCGVACKHPGEGQNNKAYHFTFCFTVGDEPIDNNTVTLTTIVIDGIPRPAYSGVDANGDPKQTVTVGAPGSKTCVFVDAEDFGTSETDPTAKLNFTYTIGGVEFTGCATAEIVGDVCGTSSPGTQLNAQPGEWPHGDGSEPPESSGIFPCNQTPGDC